MARARRRTTTKKLTNREQWNKEQRRILNEITRLREQGYDVDTSILPTINKNVTQPKLKAIKSIRRKQLREMAFTFDELGNKIGYNEYQNWLVEQPQNEYPTIDILDKIKERIEERVDVGVLYRLEGEIQSVIQDPKRLRHPKGSGRKGYYTFPVTARKNSLVETMEDTYLAYGDDYIKYLTDNEPFLSDEIDKINTVIYEEVLQSSFVNLAIELKMGMSLLPQESEMYDRMSEEL